MVKVDESVRSELLSHGVVAHCTVRSGVDRKDNINCLGAFPVREGNQPGTAIGYRKGQIG